MLLGGSAAGPGTSVRREVPGLQITSANALGLISACLLPGWTGSLPSRRLARGPVLISHDTIQTYSWHRATRDCVCWRQVWWEPGLTNQSCWWIVVLSNVIVRPPLPPPRGHLCVLWKQTRRECVNWHGRPWTSKLWQILVGWMGWGSREPWG